MSDDIKDAFNSEWTPEDLQKAADEQAELEAEFKAKREADARRSAPSKTLGQE